MQRGVASFLGAKTNNVTKPESQNTKAEKTIHKEELLDAYIKYSKCRGNAREIFKKRLEAILAAFNPEFDYDVLKYFNSSILIDEKCSKEKLDEIERITGYKFHDDNSL